MNQIRQSINKAIQERKGILVAGHTGSGKHAVLASIVNESDQGQPRFVFSGEILPIHIDGTPSPAPRVGALLRAISEAGIPVTAEVQAESHNEAIECFAKVSGLDLDTVKTIFPVVVLVTGINALEYLAKRD
jgi:energy-coupling factor transporter ATP-binding protein EcfA2